MRMNAFDLIASQLSLASLEDFSSLQADFQHLKRQIWTKETYLFRQGEIWDHVILIERGLIRCFYIEDDREINLRFLCDGSVALPFSSLCNYWINTTDTIESQEYIQTVSEVSGYRIPIKYLIDSKQYPQLDQLRIQLATEHYLSIEQRLRMIQSLKAFERYQNFLSWMPELIVNNMPNHHIASYLGITPESLSRLKKREK